MDHDFPQIRSVGLDGALISFSDRLEDASNRAALAFRRTLQDDPWDGVQETTMSLASAFVRFDPLVAEFDVIKARLADLLRSRDWYAAPLPTGRKLWRVPTVFGTDLAPQLPEVARLAGLSEAETIQRLSSARVRVLTVGFAPGQPYLGPLPPEWDIPRQTALTPQVPAGALVLAVRQFVLFTNPSPTGWRHVGQSAFRNFRPESDTPFPLGIGDEMQFTPVSPDELRAIEARDTSGNGGATCEEIPA